MTTRIWIAALVGLCIFSVPASAEVWHGLYTDATSYAIGDTIKVYASAPNQEIVIRLVKLDEFWTEAARSDVLEAGPQSSRVGSFVEYPSLSLGGRTSFTLEGWLHPTLLGGDTVVVAGQFGLNEAAAAIIITPDGRLAAYVSDTPQQTRLDSPLPRFPPTSTPGSTPGTTWRFAMTALRSNSTWTVVSPLSETRPARWQGSLLHSGWGRVLKRQAI